MKVLLCEDIEKLGWLGDIVEVKEGYARNYLLPCGLGKAATESNIRALAAEKAKRAQKRLEERKRCEQAAEVVNGAEAVISSKANEQGHLFGSVSEKEIGENLRKQGLNVADSNVKLSSHLKEVGEYSVEIRYAEGVSATVNVVVVAEKDQEESGEG